LFATTLTIAATTRIPINHRRNALARILGASMAIVIERRYRGPDESGNGGYSAGRFALAHGGDVVEVTLRLPPPLETPLELDGEQVRAGDAFVAEVRPAELGVSAPDPVAYGDAVAAASPDLDSPFPQCFVCGHARGEDGLHIHAGPVSGRTVFAAPWTPRDDTVGPEFVWAALDCPGGWAVLDADHPYLLGRITATVGELPKPGTDCVVVGAVRERSGRKAMVTSTLYGPDGARLASAGATWIAVA